ncbi:uncharacterized protein [Aristolochia californica]|uniref:uncharacterized protein n=1 Tax=Aristolochia californica TaxID=171875 RepID=UPI0035E3922C
MASFFSVKSKRKDLDDVYDDFSDFSLSSPARKIRRLDAELPPIVEEEPMIPPVVDQPIPEEQPRDSVVIEEMQPPSPNEERALIVYKLANAPSLQSPTTSGLLFKVHKELIPGFNNRVFWSGHPELIIDADSEETVSSKKCLAVVPWTPSKIPTSQVMKDAAPANNLSELMDAEAAEATSMEVEGEENSFYALGKENPQQQWQQHCIAAQLPQNASTPVMSSW